MTIPEPGQVIGVDLGGTKIEVGLVDRDDHILRRFRFPTPREPADAVIEQIVASIRLHFSPVDLLAVGIGVAGQVDAATGRVHYAPNLRWHDVPLQSQLQKALGVSVRVVNDVRAAAFAEWTCGAGQRTEHLICIFVGTGVGGGVVSGGHMLAGCSNSAGELGHVTVVAGGRLCRCSNIGCLEAYVGGWAIAARAQEAVGLDPEAGSALVQRSGSVANISAATVGSAYHEGNGLATRIITETGSYLEAAVAGFVNAFNPCVTILGGGVIEGLPELIDMIRPGVQNRALPSAAVQHRIVKAALGRDAGMIGAAILARNGVIEAA